MYRENYIPFFKLHQPLQVFPLKKLESLHRYFLFFQKSNKQLNWRSCAFFVASWLANETETLRLLLKKEKGKKAATTTKQEEGHLKRPLARCYAPFLVTLASLLRIFTSFSERTRNLCLPPLDFLLDSIADLVVSTPLKSLPERLA